MALTLRPPARRALALALVSVAIIAIALAVRLAYRTDRAAEFDRIMPSQSFISHRRAVRMLDGEGVLLWSDTDASLLKQIRRPPGYPAFLAAIYLVTGPDLRRAQLFQIAIDAVVAAIVMLIGMWLVDPAAGIVAGLLYALSPHLSVFATIVTPDAVAAWPVLIGTALVIGALRRTDRMAYAMAAGGGAAIGLSCWLTAQGLTLPLVLAAAGVLVALPGQRRRAFAIGATATAATLAIVAPLTIRNVAVYGALVPVRPGLGVTLVEGLGVYDPSFPATDGALLDDEAERSGRPEYAQALYDPDGLARERDRVRRGLVAIAARPIWFTGVMIDRVRLMLSYDVEGTDAWPRNTAFVGWIDRGGALRSVLRLLQRALFHTWLVWILVVAGGVWLLRFGHWRAGILLAVVPLHHCLLQSFLLTEYKYTLPVHAWMFLVAGASVCWLRSVRLGSARRAPVS